MSFLEGLEGTGTDWLLTVGLVVFVVPKVVLASLAMLLVTAERVPLLDRLFGDRIRSLKQGLRQLLPKPFRAASSILPVRGDKNPKT